MQILNANSRILALWQNNIGENNFVNKPREAKNKQNYEEIKILVNYPILEYFHLKMLL